MAQLIQLLVCLTFGHFGQSQAQASSLKDWLQTVDGKVTTLARAMTQTEWRFFTNVTTKNRLDTTASRAQFWNYVAEVTQQAESRTDSTDDVTMSKQLQLWRQSTTFKNQTRAMELEFLHHLTTAVEEVRQSLGSPATYSGLLEKWTAVRTRMKPQRDLFQQYIQLLASSRGQVNVNIANLTSEAMTSYKLLQAYVRKGVRELYGPHRIPSTGHIPAHLVDEVNSVSWVKLFDQIRPYKFTTSSSLTEKISDIIQMIRLVEDFFVSLGFERLPVSFWQKSIIRRSKDTALVVCFPQNAWTFWESDDYRMTGCLDANRAGMRSAVEIVSRVLALREVAGEPFILQQHSNTDYVTDAISGALSLVFLTPAAMTSLGWRQTKQEDEEHEINFLMEMALDRLPALASYHVINEWQTTIFTNKQTTETWNQEWWKLRCNVEGISPPVARDQEDFDTGASTSLLLNIPGQRLVQSAVAQFQIVKSLCQVANQPASLAQCNLHGSKAVGDKIRSVWRQGRLLSPEDKLLALTASKELDPAALVTYLQPLTSWLQANLQPEDTEWTDVCPDPVSLKVQDGESMKRFLQRVNTESVDRYFQDTLAAYNYDTNLTDHNKQIKINSSLHIAMMEKKFAREVAMFDLDHLDNDTRRQVKAIADIGINALKDNEKIEKINSVLAQMSSAYSKAKVCLQPHNKSSCVNLDPGLEAIMSKSRDYDELSRVWKLWRDATGPGIKPLYTQFVNLGNEGVRQLGYEDLGDHWRSRYDDPNFVEELENLLQQLQPLYQQLHAYVRHRLVKHYGEERFPQSGHIPAHLLGNMWAQQWNNIYDLLVPYPGKESVDVTDEMIKQNYTVERMFRTAEEFYTSLNLSAMNERFWNFSMLRRPKDGRDVVCHASAWNFYNSRDFRIKMCTKVNMEDLITIHHEMGHVEYYMQYKHQPVVYQNGANPGFHEAIGDTMALSVSTPKHLHQIGLLPQLQQDEEADINYLLKMALEKIAFLPFGYLIDQWRWSVFSGATDPDHYNQHWWSLRCKHQGLSPPVERSERDFDPGAKFHVPDNTPYIRYFVSFVMQFTFYQRLCQAANHSGPLHTCDFYQSQEAGKIFKTMLEKGSSEPWPDVLQAFNGQRSMDASAILEYFQPLMEWLSRNNTGLPVGWTDHCPLGLTTKIRDEQAGEQWLQDYDQEVKQRAPRLEELRWRYSTNLTDHNQHKQVEGELEHAQWVQKKAAEAMRYDWRHFSQDSLVRQFRFATNIGTSAMKNQTKLSQLTNVQSKIQGIYSKASVVNTTSKQVLKLEPELTRLMATSRDYEELLWAWRSWRDATGPVMKAGYEQYVSLSNEAVRDLGYADTGAYWRSSYDSDTLEQDLQSLLEQLSPLYTELHAYVRRKLMAVYGADKFPASGHIPAHILGNMWSQSWVNLYDLLLPFPNKTAIDVTPELLRQGYTVEKMFSTAESFFVSLGLEPLPLSFWRDSMLERPRDGRDVVCHASAWDMFNGKDFRIKMCTDVNMEDLITIHHEMGHIQYYLQYKHLPHLFKDGANQGFHEAIGDTLALSVSSPKHLKTIQLLSDIEEDQETDINFLMKMALTKVAFLPFGYLIDQWRWSVFSGATDPDHYNQHWWSLRCKYQGIYSAIPRNASAFDPGAKYHIPNNYPYISYFVAYVLQFQFYKSLCNTSGYQGPLHACDFYRSKEAGQKLSAMLRLGASKSWPDALEQMTGTRRMDVGPMLEYFQPLLAWLQQQNAGQPTGWSPQCPGAQAKSSGASRAAQWLAEFSAELQEFRVNETLAEWAYTSNITDENEKKSVEASVRSASFRKEKAHEAEELDWRNLTDVATRRQFKLLTNIGPSALSDPEKFKRMETLQANMEGIYGAGKVCLNSKTQCLGLEPDLEDIMAESQDYDRMLKVWKGWRDVTGPRMKSLYSEFVNLSNEGVKEIGYEDTGEFWRADYESDTFQEDLLSLLQQLQPLYRQLHAYVRHKLQDLYGKQHFPNTGHIPAHLLGNMWAQEWNNLYRLVQPYPERPGLDVTPALKHQNYTVRQMFKTAEEFFSSLGFEPLPKEFWEGSIVEKVKGRDMVCHASAWDFYNAKDFRIKMCTYVTQEDLVTIHHEMGHIQYFLQYRHQPQMFRDGANPGFHEAVGDTIALSVSTPGHLRKIGLLPTGEDNQLDEINFLLKMALDKVAFLPFGYLIDQWRWSVFSGATDPDHYNQHWWSLRCRYQGIFPPVARSEADFDPGAKYHIPGNTPYIRYFASFVLQFQFHQALCKAAGHTGPIHRCDIYHSQAAGSLLRSMLAKGSSTPWPDVLEEMTGSRKMDAGALLHYFQPLHDWLQKENAQQRTGWSWHCPDPNLLHQRSLSPVKPQPSSHSHRHRARVFHVALFVMLAASGSYLR